MTQTKNKWIAPYCVGVPLLFAAVLIIPATRAQFTALTAAHPYAMGFLKFALLALLGELAAKRISTKSWQSPCYPLARLIIWGLIGMWITYMMKVFSSGIGAMMASGQLIGGSSKFVRALLISATMNLTFGPTFMAVHKCSDRCLEQKAAGQPISVNAVINGIHWDEFVRFTLFKTVPLFWIPAHTVTFLLPEAYQVMAAALLSVALGIILSVKK